MKPIAIFLIMFCSGISGFAQNRIHGWDIEKITSIEVERTTPDGAIQRDIFTVRQEVDIIISFLKKVDFKELNGNSIDTEVQKKNRSYKLIFHGQRDQVYLYRSSACIGKTSFLTDDAIIDDFQSLIEELKKKSR